MSKTSTKKRRDKGAGEIKQLNDGRWRGRLRYTLVPHGKQFTQLFYGKSKSDVQKQMRDFNPEEVTEDMRFVTVGSYCWKWLITYKFPNMEHSSFDKLESMFRIHIQPEIGMIQLQKLKADDIQKIINKMKREGYSYSTVKKAYDFMNQVMKHAVGLHHIKDNPMQHVIMPSRKLFPKHQVRFFTDDEIKKITEEAQRVENGERVYHEGDAFIVLYNSGLRRGELAGLNKSDIDWVKCRLAIHRHVQASKKRDELGNAVEGREELITLPKTDASYRTVALNKTAMEALRRLCDLHPESEWVVCMPNGSRITLDRLDRTCTKILKNAGVEKAGLHAFRHTFASRLIAKGANIHQVSKILGHSRIQITLDYYAHLFPDEDLAVVSMLDED